MTAAAVAARGREPGPDVELDEDDMRELVEAKARRDWPAWAPTAGLVEWLGLQRALKDLGREPGCATEPERWWSKRPADVEDAVAVCSWCPVQGWCREYALAAGERAGTWGGMTEADRAAIGRRER